MSKRVSADDYEEQDGWIARLRDRWFGEHEEDEESEEFGANGQGSVASRNRRGAGSAPLLQVHSHRGSQITKRVPHSLADAQRAAEDLKDRRPVIVNLESTDDELARRVIDFISGVTYALNGFYEKVGDKVFLFTPANIIIADEDEIEPGGKGPFLEEQRHAQ
ncbi:MAG: cell division protein SepF [Armatimonadetes bacterium]|nr:cell division protein SepF [Armatimonadota bacterium]